jgi:hypothetical protein
MKILDGMPISGQPPAGPKAPGADKPGGPTFGEVLKETVDASAKTDGQTRTASVTPSTAVKPAALQPAASAADSRSIDRIERFLDVMDDYRCKLGDPQCSLKQIQPLMERVTEEKEKMQLLLEALPDGQPLKDVLNRALVTASTEAWKFNRGDYI